MNPPDCSPSHRRPSQDQDPDPVAGVAEREGPLQLVVPEGGSGETARGDAPTGPPVRSGAIPEHCRDCWERERGKDRCEVEDCPLYPYQAGHGTEGPEAQREVLQAVRAFCLVCACGDPDEVESCPAVDCALWPWRFGRWSPPRPPGSRRAVPKAAENEAPDEGRMTEVERACIEAGQVVERRCPVCGEEPLGPRRRKCDRCRRYARRATKRRAQRRWRQKV